MHPALSVIVFTTFSGAGYGLLAWLGVLAPAGLLPAERGFGAAALGLALATVTAGLIASTFHLGHPERAWRAFSQWRSSWLSREGVASVTTYGPALLFAIGWVIFGSAAGLWALFGLATALAAAVTVGCTACIYQSLKPIQRWNNGWVLPNYLALAAMTGALWLAALTQIFGLDPLAGIVAVLGSIPLALALKVAYWRFIDGSQSRSTAGSATGLGAFGQVRLFEAPHTSENYLMKEMGFRIARKHAAKLRRIAIGIGFVAPFALTLASLAFSGLAAAALAVVAALLGMVGVLVERWLFFAEAKHTVTLYYGQSTA